MLGHPSKSPASSSPIISFFTDVSYGLPARGDPNDSLLSADVYTKCSSGVKRIPTRSTSVDAIRSGQGRRLKKQMGCKEERGEATERDTTLATMSKKERKKRERKKERAREGSGIENEGKREAIVSGAHTGVGLDSFIGRAAPHDRESGRKRGRKRDF